jgi:23S rRNA (guanosine2251-2'-O)-methyltransferase
VYGRNAVAEALRAGRVERIHIARGAHGSVSEIASDATARGIPIAEADRGWLRVTSGGDHHQGIAAAVKPYRYSSLDGILALARQRGEPPLLLILDCVQDPQNLGTLLRTAEAVGVHGVVLPEHRAAHVTPAVEKASAGAVEHLLVARETNLTRTILRLREEGLWVAGVESFPTSVDFRKASLAGPLAIVVGSEGKGISRLVRESCDFLVSLPMRGAVSSLNASVAGSIVLYEVLRQRATPSR